jgi:hypothetical protein
LRHPFRGERSPAGATEDTSCAGARWRASKKKRLQAATVFVAAVVRSVADVPEIPAILVTVATSDVADDPFHLVAGVAVAVSWGWLASASGHRADNPSHFYRVSVTPETG